MDVMMSLGAPERMRFAAFFGRVLQFAASADAVKPEQSEEMRISTNADACAWVGNQIHHRLLSDNAERANRVEGALGC